MPLTLYFTVLNFFRVLILQALDLFRLQGLDFFRFQALAFFLNTE